MELFDRQKDSEGQGERTVLGNVEQNKSKRYNVIKGKKILNVGTLNLPTGGRGNTAKKNHRN